MTAASSPKSLPPASGKTPAPASNGAPSGLSSGGGSGASSPKAALVGLPFAEQEAALVPPSGGSGSGSGSGAGGARPSVAAAASKDNGAKPKDDKNDEKRPAPVDADAALAAQLQVEELQRAGADLGDRDDPDAKHAESPRAAQPAAAASAATASASTAPMSAAATANAGQVEDDDEGPATTDAKAEALRAERAARKPKAGTAAAVEGMTADARLRRELEVLSVRIASAHSLMKTAPTFLTATSKLAAAESALKSSGGVGAAEAALVAAGKAFEEARSVGLKRGEKLASAVAERVLPAKQRLAPYAATPFVQQIGTFETAFKERMSSFAAADLAPTLEGHYNDLAPLAAWLDDMVLRLAWIAGRPQQANYKQAERARLANRHALNIAGLTKLKTDIGDLSATEKPAARTAFNDAKVNGDADASAKLDEMANARVIRRGLLQETYVSRFDNPAQNEFSVEWTIEGLDTIVLHAHCTAAGVPKEGNGTHWKKKDEKRDTGTSHEVSAVIRTLLIDSAANKARRAADAKKK